MLKQSMIKKLSLLGAVSFATASVSFAQTTSQADTVVTKSVELDEQLDACAARRIAHHVVKLLNLMCPFHCIVRV